MKNTGTKHEPPLSLNFGFDEAIHRLTRVNTKEIPEPKEESGNKATPFLKWVGGKRGIIEDLKKKVPATFSNYYEPFVGGGALYFELQPIIKKAFLSDVNIDLAITYKVIKEDAKKLIELLKKYAISHNEDFYYRMRAKHDLSDPIELAARMIYLNKTCFNGLFRVNKKGEFNVPMGKYANPGICQEDNILACNKALHNATIEYKDYMKIKPQKGDFVYFDPPYHPTDDTSFTAYSKLDFSEKDQSNLAEFCTTLHKQEVKIMLSNSNTKFIRNLYKSNIFNTTIVNAPRMVNCKPNGRGKTEEVLITNY